MNTRPRIGLSRLDGSGLWMSVFSFPSGVRGSRIATILPLSFPWSSKISKVASSFFQNPTGEAIPAAPNERFGSKIEKRATSGKRIRKQIMGGELESLPERGGHRRVIRGAERFGLNDDDEFRRICGDCRAHCSVLAFVAMEFPFRAVRVILVTHPK